MSEAKPKDESGPRIERALRVVLPIVVLGLGVVLWGVVVRWRDIPPYVLPGPELVFTTLVADWTMLSDSFTLSSPSCAPVCASQMRAVLSCEAVRMRSPSRLNAADPTRPPWPVSATMRRPVAASHTREM